MVRIKFATTTHYKMHQKIMIKLVDLYNQEEMSSTKAFY